MNIFDIYSEKIIQIINTAQNDGLLKLPDNLNGINVDIPPAHFDCDISTNVAMVLAKPNQKSPIEIANQLSQLIKKLCGKAARIFVETSEVVKITKKNIEKFLGPKKYPAERLETKNMVGITNGLAWTSVGCVVMKIESVLMPGTGKLILTGQLGDVMKESAQAALSYARAHAEEFKIAYEKFTNFDLHIHLPAGGVPKDGPSAGITLLSSILSTYTGRPVNASLAMTGELNLRGDVMPIGGVKEKVLAAKQHNLSTVILPEENRSELSAIQDLIQDMNIILVRHADEVLEHVLLPLQIK